jgi:hypothetical protein
MAEAVRALRLADVYFRDERVSVDPEVVPPFWPSHTRTQFKIVTRILHDSEVSEEERPSDAAETKRFLEIEFVGSVRCLADHSSDSEERELLNMEVSIGLLYQVIAQCSEDSLEAFVRLNAPYHAIPYWREHVHGACIKRRFAPITVPMYTQAVSTQRPAADENAVAD